MSGRTRTRTRAPATDATPWAATAPGDGVRFAALLRGINVGRAKRIGMAELRRAVETAGFTGVSTLLNSGNVLFTAPAGVTPADAAADVEGAITGAFGIVSRVLVLSGADVEVIVGENPLADVASNPSRMFATVLAEPLASGPVALRAALETIAAADWGHERAALGTRAIYQWCPDGSAGSRLPEAVAKAVRDRATTRNWGTMGKLRALLAYRAPV